MSEKDTPHTPIRFVRNDRRANFIPRSKALNRLNEIVTQQHSNGIVSILGPSGAGKTALALEMVYQIQAKALLCSVFWVRAVNLAAFESDMLGIANALNLYSGKTNKADAKQLVKRSLSNSSFKWLLILDGADDETIWTDSSHLQNSSLSAVGHDLSRYIPKSANGSVVLTTRSQTIANLLADTNLLELGGLQAAEALEMLTAGLDPPLVPDNELAESLLDKLGRLPLPVVQATSYMNIAQCSMQRYIELINETTPEAVKCFEAGSKYTAPVFESWQPISTTWLISFQHIHRSQSIAADCLMSMICLGGKNVPQSLLSDVALEIDGPDAMSISTSYRVADIVTCDDDNTTQERLFNIHDIAYITLRGWMKRERRVESCIKECLQRCLQKSYSSTPQSRQEWVILLPLMKHLCAEAATYHITERYDLLHHMAKWLHSDLQYDAAAELSGQVLEYYMTHVPDDPKTWEINRQYGVLLSAQGRFSAAEFCLQESLANNQRILGEESIEAISCMRGLLENYDLQGRTKEALELGRRTFTLAVQVLGNESKTTVLIMSSLSLALQRERHFEEAEELAHRVIDFYKRTHGEDNFETVTTMYDLAILLCEAGPTRLEEAETLTRRILELRQRLEGEETPRTVRVMALLAVILRDQARFEESETLFKQCMDINKRTVGYEHIYNLRDMGHYASMLTCQGRTQEALDFRIRYCEDCQRILGYQSSDTFLAMESLATLFFNCDRYEEAAELEVKCLEIRRQTLGNEHFKTLSAMYSLADTRKAQSRWNEAIGLLTQALEIAQRTRGLEDATTSKLSTDLQNWKQEQLQDQQDETINLPSISSSSEEQAPVGTCTPTQPG